MERHVQAVEGGDEEQIAFSSQSAGCVVADFIFRYQNDHDGTAGPLTWEMVKAEIAACFWLSRQLGPCHVKTVMSQKASGNRSSMLHRIRFQMKT